MYFVSPRLIASIAACLDIVGRIEIRLAGAEADDVPSFGFQLARFLRDGDGGGRLHAGKGVGKEGHDNGPNG